MTFLGLFGTGHRVCEPPQEDVAFTTDDLKLSHRFFAVGGFRFKRIFEILVFLLELVDPDKLGLGNKQFLSLPVKLVAEVDEI